MIDLHAGGVSASPGPNTGLFKGHQHVSQAGCSQQGRRKALTASLLQMAHRSLVGMSSAVSELEMGSRGVSPG